MGWGGLDRLPCRSQAKLDWAGLQQFHDIRSLWDKMMKEVENERSSVKCSVKHNLKNILFRNIIPYLDIESEVLKVSSISQNLKLKS